MSHVQAELNEEAERARAQAERSWTAQERRRSDSAVWQEHDLIIDRGDGAPFNLDTLSSGWRPFVTAHALPKIRFHDLRHAHAT